MGLECVVRYEEDEPARDAMMPYALAHALHGFGSVLAVNTLLSLLQSRLKLHCAGAEVRIRITATAPAPD